MYPFSQNRQLTTATRTQVAIIGGGPAGLLLSHILHRNGVDSILLERQSRAYVHGSEYAPACWRTAASSYCAKSGSARAWTATAIRTTGRAIAWEGHERFFIDTKKFTGKIMMTYGQTALTEDLYAARDIAGGAIIDQAADVQLHELTTNAALCDLREGRI